jgi:hypothetical protein
MTGWYYFELFESISVVTTKVVVEFFSFVIKEFQWGYKLVNF